jgi:hypothetical protein
LAQELGASGKPGAPFLLPASCCPLDRFNRSVKLAALKREVRG